MSFNYRTRSRKRKEPDSKSIGRTTKRKKPAVNEDVSFNFSTRKSSRNKAEVTTTTTTTTKQKTTPNKKATATKKVATPTTATTTTSSSSSKRATRKNAITSTTKKQATPTKNTVNRHSATTETTKLKINKAKSTKSNTPASTKRKPKSTIETYVNEMFSDALSQYVDDRPIPSKIAPVLQSAIEYAVKGVGEELASNYNVTINNSNINWTSYSNSLLFFQEKLHAEVRKWKTTKEEVENEVIDMKHVELSVVHKQRVRSELEGSLSAQISGAPVNPLQILVSLDDKCNALQAKIAELAAIQASGTAFCGRAFTGLEEKSAGEKLYVDVGKPKKLLEAVAAFSSPST